MRLSEMIEELQELEQQVGDVPVFVAWNRGNPMESPLDVRMARVDTPDEGERLYLALADENDYLSGPAGVELGWDV